MPRQKKDTTKQVRSKKSKKEQKQTEVCPICIDRGINTSIKNCAHEFCLKCIKKWSKKHQECPLCRKQFSQVNHKGKKIILRLKKQSKKINIGHRVLSFRSQLLPYSNEDSSYQVLRPSIAQNQADQRNQQQIVINNNEPIIHQLNLNRNGSIFLNQPQSQHDTYDRNINNQDIFSVLIPQNEVIPSYINQNLFNFDEIPEESIMFNQDLLQNFDTFRLGQTINLHQDQENLQNRQNRDNNILDYFSS